LDFGEGQASGVVGIAGGVAEGVGLARNLHSS
jgi:hypothetical protein